MVLHLAVLSSLFASTAGAFLIPSKNRPESVKTVFQRSYCMGLLNETIIVYHDGQYRYTYSHCTGERSYVGLVFDDQRSGTIWLVPVDGVESDRAIPYCLLFGGSEEYLVEEKKEELFGYITRADTRLEAKEEIPGTYKKLDLAHNTWLRSWLVHLRETE